MRYVLVLTACLFSVGLAHADWPFDGKKEAVWPFKDCACSTSTEPAKIIPVDPDTDEPPLAPELPATEPEPVKDTKPVEQPKTAATPTYHLEYRQQCSPFGGCSAVAVWVPDVPAVSSGTTATAGPACTCLNCPMNCMGQMSGFQSGTCTTGNCGQMSGCSSGSCGSTSQGARCGPVRRFFGRCR